MGNIKVIKKKIVIEPEGDLLKRIKNIEEEVKYWKDKYWDDEEVKKKLQGQINHKFIEIDVFLRRSYKENYKLIDELFIRVEKLEKPGSSPHPNRREAYSQEAIDEL